MAWQEKPPIMSGNLQQDVNALRDYLFRMAGSLEPAISSAPAATVKYDTAGRPQYSPEGGVVTDKEAIEAVRKNAQELKSLIIKTAENLTDAYQLEDSTLEETLRAAQEAGDSGVRSYVDGKVDEYNSLYVAKSEFGTYKEEVQSTVVTTAQGEIANYNYNEIISSSALAGTVSDMGDSIGILQTYLTSITGEIRRGLVPDPDHPGSYVTGIAIAQNLSFTGQTETGADGYTYYYMTEGQTFGLYTSTGWQFWIDGYKKGWFSSVDGMLHVANIYVENVLQLGTEWEFSYGPKVMWLKWIGT